MKKLPKFDYGFSPIILLLFVCLIALVAGSIYLNMQKKAGNPAPNSAKEENLVLDDSKSASQLSFQDTLKQFCTKQDILGTNGQKVGFYYTIDLNLLPISFGQDLVINTKDSATVNCANPNPNKNFVMIRYDADYRMYIYDDLSEELGHGPPPFIGPTGASINRKDAPVLYIYLGWPEAGDALVGEVPVYLRGIKDLKLKNGQTIHVSTDRLIRGEKDPTLMTFLRKHTDLSRKDAEVLTGQGIDQTFALEFITDKQTLAPAESEAISFVDNILNSINVK